MRSTAYFGPVVALFSLVAASGISIFADDISLSLATWSFAICAWAALLTATRTLAGIPPTSLYALQFYAICLFIGGRFAAYLMSSDQNPFEMAFFVSYSLNDFGINQLMSLVIGAISAMELGACIAAQRSIRTEANRLIELHVKPFALKCMLLIVVPLMLVSLYESYKLVRDFGYLGLYLGQASEQGSVLKSIATTLTFALMGLATAYGDKSTRRIYFLIYFFMAFINLLYGARGGFVTFILFGIWIITDLGARKVSFGKIFCCFAGIGIFVIYFLNSISARGEGSVDGALFDNIATLLYDQGVTLMVFDLATKTHDYPLVPYLQNFIPGVSFLAGLFSHLRPQDVGFSKYLSYVNNSSAYEDGYGLGWSLFGDLYVYAQGNWAVFVILAMFCGYAISKAEVIARNNNLCKALLVAAAPSIIFLPRAGLNSVFPLMVYTVFIALVLYTLSRLLVFVTYRQRVDLNVVEVLK